METLERQKAKERTAEMAKTKGTTAGVTLKVEGRAAELLLKACQRWAPKLHRVHAGPAGMGYSEEVGAMLADREILIGEAGRGGLVDRLDPESLLGGEKPTNGAVELKPREARVAFYALRHLAGTLDGQRREEKRIGHDVTQHDQDLALIGTWDEEGATAEGGLLEALYGGWEAPAADPLQTSAL